MRASRQKVKGHIVKTADMQSPQPDVHISGAESICLEEEVPEILRKYLDRATTHPRGKPDRVVITIEELKKPLRPIRSLPVVTIKCVSSTRAEAITETLLRSAGVSIKAITSAFQILRSGEAMRGAALLSASSGRRVEPDLQRGVRVSRLGISRTAEKTLATELNKFCINTETVREALILASKVASCRDIAAEVCISDDPDYTTGYVSSTSLGYVRIPHIKKKRDRRGGRIFFLREDADILRVLLYLEKTPVIVDAVRPCAGEKTIDEFIDCFHK